MSMPPRSRTGSGLLVAVLIALVVVVVAVVALAAAGITPQRLLDSFFPVGGATPVTVQSHSVRTLYDIVFWIAAVIFVLVEVVIVFAAVRYRRKPTDEALPAQTHGNNLVEVIWTVIPLAIVLFLFAVSWQTLNVVEAKGPTNVHIRAVAARFQWAFDYLDENGNTLFTQNIPVGDTGGMVVPVGEPVLVSLRSLDVNHAFYVPKFLFKRDAIPGKENSFDFTVDEEGTYRGQCAELCGPFHGSMVFEVHAVSKTAFDTWMADQIAKTKASAAPLASPVGKVVELAAQNTAYTTTSLQAPAGKDFTIHFKNQDASTQHNVEIKDVSGKSLFKGDLVTGPGEANYIVKALPAGNYTFNCDVHPTMTGTLTVQ